MWLFKYLRSWKSSCSSSSDSAEREALLSSTSMAPQSGIMRGSIFPRSWTKDWDLVPNSSVLIAVLLVSCSMITSTTLGYDGSMMNGLNILPAYNDYFGLVGNPVGTGLNTASVWIGGILAGLSMGKVTDIIGRRPALFYSAIITIIAVVIQTAAQDVAMFVIGRILIGFGTSASGICGPVYLAETLPFKWRAWGLGVFNDFFYVGGLIAAGVTYGTSLNSFGSTTWSWRVPSLVQGVFSIGCLMILPFIPESPRWLAYQGRREEALAIVARTHANGDANSEIVLIQYKEIIDTIDYEKNVAETLSMKQMWETKSARKRILIGTSVAVFSTLSGNVIVSYYLGSMLDNAGITNPTTQLQINIILNVWCFFCSLAGTWFADRVGRKPTGIISTGLLTIFLFMVGALTKTYGDSTNTSGIYATVACIFLFQGAYSFGWTPLLYIIPPEVLNYAIRANGMGVFQFVLNATALWAVFAFPIALADIGWKTYMINGTWDVFELIAISAYWVETKGKTLEEIDAIMDGVKHSDVPDVDDIMKGKGDLQVATRAVSTGRD